MSILSAYLTPHPPLIVPTIGRGQERMVETTIRSMKTISREIAALKPETILVVTPHGPLFSDGIALLYEDRLEGDFRSFGEREYRYDRQCDKELIDEMVSVMTDEYGLNGALIDCAAAEYFETNCRIDHGALVPLYFVDEVYTAYNLVVMTYGLMSPVDLYRVGMATAKAIEETGRRVVVIASGDLSHRLKDSGPYDFHPSGPQFDKMFLEYLAAGETMSLLEMDPEFCEDAGECGKRSVEIMLGTLDGLTYDPECLSYEGPFGVGYGVCAFRNPQPGAPSKLEALIHSRKAHVGRLREKESLFVQLARETIEEYVRSGETLRFDHTRYYRDHDLKSLRKGAFVTLRDSGGLRGCIGTYLPSRDCLGEEIIHNAISAATRDPRFPSVGVEELDDLVISVDVLERPESIAGPEELDPEHYGVIVSSGHRRGLLLPHLKGIHTVAEQLRIARGKAGIKEGEAVTLQRFEVVRHE